MDVEDIISMQYEFDPDAPDDDLIYDADEDEGSGSKPPSIAEQYRAGAYASRGAGTAGGGVGGADSDEDAAAAAAAAAEDEEANATPAARKLAALLDLLSGASGAAGVDGAEGASPEIARSLAEVEETADEDMLRLLAKRLAAAQVSHGPCVRRCVGVCRRADLAVMV